MHCCKKNLKQHSDNMFDFYLGKVCGFLHFGILFRENKSPKAQALRFSNLDKKGFFQQCKSVSFLLVSRKYFNFCFTAKTFCLRSKKCRNNKFIFTRDLWRCQRSLFPQHIKHEKYSSAML